MEYIIGFALGVIITLGAAAIVIFTLLEKIEEAR